MDSIDVEVWYHDKFNLICFKLMLFLVFGLDIVHTNLLLFNKALLNFDSLTNINYLVFIWNVFVDTVL